MRCDERGLPGFAARPYTLGDDADAGLIKAAFRFVEKSQLWPMRARKIKVHPLFPPARQLFVSLF